MKNNLSKFKYFLITKSKTKHMKKKIQLFKKQEIFLNITEIKKI